MAAKPKQVAQAKTMAAAGKSALQIQNKTGVSSNRAGNLIQKAGSTKSAAPVYTNSAGDVVQQQASLASSPVAQERFNSLQGQYGSNLQSQFIPGLMAPGMKGYDPSTGGGNFAFARGNIDPEALRAWYRTGSTDLAEGDRAKYTLDALNQTTNTATMQTPSAQTSTSKNKRGLASAGTNVSRKEALKISREEGISVSRVMDRALGKGQTLGAALVNKYNAGKLDDRNYIQKATDNVFRGMGGKSQYQPESLNKLNTFGKMPKGSVYGGMTSTGTPVIDMKRPNSITRSAGNIDPVTSSGGTNATGVMNGSNVGADTSQPSLKELLPEEPIQPVFQSANGDNLSGNASGFRVAKSSWKKSGKNMAGTNSLKIKSTGLASGVGLSVSGRMK
jgi:hypothetical protein